MTNEMKKALLAGTFEATKVEQWPAIYFRQCGLSEPEADKLATTVRRDCVYVQHHCRSCIHNVSGRVIAQILAEMEMLRQMTA